MGPSWCEEERLLASIFRFPHKGWQDMQADTATNEFRSMLCDLLEQLEGGEEEQQLLWPGLQPADLRRMRCAVACLAAPTTSWFGDYGCALLAVPVGEPSEGAQPADPAGGGDGPMAEPAGEPDVQPEPGSVALLEVGLDGWQFDTHSLDTSSIQHGADCQNSAVLHCGQLPAGLLQAFHSTLAAVLAKAKKRKGDERSAAGGHQGHQKTPAMIRALALQALEQLAAGEGAKVKERVPQGGFTDVGLHTGGQPRDTAWPLVREVFKAALHHVPACQAFGEPAPHFAETAEAHLCLWLLQRQVPLITAAGATSTNLNAAVLMLQAVAEGGRQLAELGHDVSHFEAASSSARVALEAVRAERAAAAAAESQLPPLDAAAFGPGSYRLPRGVVPPLAPPQAEGGGLEAAKEREARNLGTLPLPAAPRVAFAELLRVLESTPERSSGSDDRAAQHALCMVEHALFERANTGAGFEPLPEAEVDALVKVVEEYRAVLHCFLASSNAEPRMQSDLCSRGVLVVWLALCFVHAATEAAHPLLASYGVGVDWQSLQHLVLSDRPATDAALAAAAYLRKHTQPGRGVFTLADGAQATFQLARRFAQQDGRMKQLWQEEQQAAKERRAAHWEQVEAQKAELVRLRAQLRVQKATLASRDAKHTAAEEKCSALERQYGYYHTNAQEARQRVNAAFQKYSIAFSAVASTETAIESELQPPEPVIQPLPEHHDAAAPWLFFAYAPPLFRHLGFLTFLAQQCLLPPTKEVAALVREAKAPSTVTLVDYYNSRQQSQWLEESTGRVGASNQHGPLLVSNAEVPEAKQVRLATVDHYTGDHHGVWHPDDMALRLCWRCRGGEAAGPLGAVGWINPWAAVPPRQVVDSFTEQLSEGRYGEQLSRLQWAMPLYDPADAERGNLGIARQDQRPNCLSKPGFLAFAALRAYPLPQGSKLCAALHDRALPFDQPAVQALVRQASYQLGALTDATPPAPLWRTDWGGGEGGVLCTLHAELAALAADLEGTPREAGAVLLLGELAAFFSAWHPPLRDVARRFAAAAARWADELEPAAAQAPPDAARPLRAKQCLLRQTALLCHAAGPLSGADVEEMLGLAVQAHHGAIYAAGTDLEQQLQELKVLCHWALARRTADILQAVDARPAILTSALRRVLQRAPADLAWQRLAWGEGSASSSASFDAVGGDGVLYSINCQDGTVLEDGEPPGRLPREVLDHRLYRRSFGAWEFEVTQAGGVRRTIAPVAGRFYEFHTSPASEPDGEPELVVMEVALGPGGAERQRLQLLDPGPDLGGGGWGADLPIRLRELHSHWLDREGRAIVLRPLHFRDRDAAFLLQWSQAPAAKPAPVSYVCRSVPPHLACDDWSALVARHDSQLADQLVLHQSGVTTALSKFESLQFLHTYVPACSAGSGSGDAPEAQSMIFELPRFRLRFELRGGVLRSLDRTGYRLAHCQQLWAEGDVGAGPTYTLPDLQQYLVLEPDEAAAAPGSSSAPPAAAQRTLVLVPVGRVARQPGRVEVQHGSASGDELQAHIYELHPRFGHLLAGSVHARLQLAALYAATGSLLPEPCSRATGAQLAMQLVRQCWGVRTLEPAELDLLATTARLGGHMAAGLRLLCHELRASACQLNGLHFPPPLEVPPHCRPAALDPEWATAYQQERQRVGSSNFRLLLSAHEEVRAQGLVSKAPQPPLWKLQRQYTPIEVPPCPVAASAVPGFEAALLQLVKWPATAAAAADGTLAQPVPCYPLPVGGGGGGGRKGAGKKKRKEQPTPLHAAMHAELEASWATHHRTLEPEGVQPGAAERIAEMQAEVQALRQQAETHLHEHLASVPADVGWPGTAFRLQRDAGTAPQHGLLDLLLLALPGGQQRALQFNPFLSQGSAVALQAASRTWLQLCVLEDRLQRLVAWSADPASLPQLIQELRVRREWSPDRHPAWLVFEAEGQLQIRPQQYWVARHLMDNFGHIVQLNMGEGKTRVILPMLILHFANGQDLVRLNLLPALLEEAYAHLHATLCASVLGRRLYVQPFHRDVAPTPRLLAAMRSSLDFCRKSGGVLLTTPERRLSLRLKRQELWQQGKQALWQGIDALEALPTVDLLDESDELLTHRWQLIYAWGAATELPAQQARARAIQALLRILSSDGQRKGPLRDVLAGAGVAAAAGPGHDKPGGWRGWRLLPGAPLEAAAVPLRCQLALAVLEEPPYQLRWLRSYPDQELLLRCMTDPAEDATALLAAAQPPLSEDEHADVYALRGLLACGVLQHGLMLRHLVDHGVDDRPSALTPMSIPYRAARTPAERAQWAQPDTQLLLTNLAYYERGLSKWQLLEALRKLLDLGLNARQAEYESWVALARADVSPEELEPVGEVRWLDASNSAQLDLLLRLFSHNQAAVDFWLNTCVFPRETSQFPGRLVATAWDLADTAGRRVVGFSGTNDNHRLLPLHVRQYLRPDEHRLAGTNGSTSTPVEAQSDAAAILAGTNGRMLHLLLAPENSRYDTLAPPQGEGSVGEALLRFAVEQGLDAVIDCGALLSGTTNSAAADLLLPLLVAHRGGRYRGVSYFDEGSRQWVVCDLQGRRLPRHVSPIREAQALVLFDEARCRGADLQLRPDARAVLTLGPATTKDKLCQSAGRLRKLGKGQTLQMVGTPDVSDKIRRVAAGVATASQRGQGGDSSGGGADEPLCSRHVLAWAMHNTVAATQKGVVEWAHQGLQHAATRGAPERALLPEVLGLEEMYGAARALCGVPAVVQGQAEGRLEACGASLGADMAALMERVVEASAELGAGHEVVAQGGLGEECERELEREEEEEEEVEREIARIQPRAEQDWDYRRALGAQSLADLQASPGLHALSSLPELARQLAPMRIQSWSADVFATRNFARAVELETGDPPNEYLRPLGEMLLLPAHNDGVNERGRVVLLLSEREANGVLRALWSGSGAGARARAEAPGSATPAPLLVSLSYLAAAQPPVGAAAGGAAPPLRLAAALRGGGDGASWQELGQLAEEVAAGTFTSQLVSMQLYDGQSTFVPPKQLEDLPWHEQREVPPLALLRGLVAGHAGTAEALAAMRGKHALFARSQLERACDPLREQEAGE